MHPLLIKLKRPLQMGLAAALLVGVVTLFLPNYYRSEARILPVDAGTGVLGSLSGAAAAFGVSLPGGDNSDANFVDILKSRWLMERLLDTEFQFKARAWRFGEERQHQEKLSTYLDAGNTDQSLEALASMVEVSRDLRSKVILLTVDTKSPTLSQQVAQRCLQLLEEFIQQKTRTRGGAKAAFAKARLEEARGAQTKAEAVFQEFFENNRNYQVSLDPSVRIKGTRLEAELRLRMQLVATLAQSYEQALMEEKNDVPILNVLDAGSLPLEKHRPKRSVFIALAFLFASVGNWAYANRDWIRTNLLDSEEPGGGGSSPKEAR